MDRRTLTQALAAMLAPGKEPESLLLKRNGWMPNNEKLPVLLYRSLVTPATSVEAVEDLIAKSGWKPQWRNGVYPFHHYHSTAHEVLGFARGEAKLILGGEVPGGVELTVKAGDLAVLPCGTGHCRVSASSDFLVIGAYTLNQDWDLCRAAPDPASIERMKKLPYPAQGPLTRPWR